MGTSSTFTIEQEIASIQKTISSIQREKEWCQGQLRALTANSKPDKRGIELRRKQISQCNAKIATAKKSLANAKERLRAAKKKK